MPDMKVIPLGDRLLLKFSFEAAGMIEDEEGHVVTKAGLSVPREALTERSEAKVIAVGEGCTDSFKAIVKAGDDVLIGRYAGEAYKKVLMVYQAEVIAKLEFSNEDEEEEPTVKLN